jgi:non-heme chloroperoxidase
LPTFITHDGTQLSYESYGEGPVVVFCNSVMLRTDMWDYQVASLVQQGYRCVLHDWRGHGRSDRPSNGYDYDTLAQDVDALVETLGIDEFFLIGHSMGAAVAVRYLVRNGRGRVRKLVLISPMLPFLKQTPDNPGGIPVEIFEHSESLLRHDRSRWLADQQQVFFASHLRAVSPAMIDWARRDCESASMYSVLTLQHHIFHEDHRSMVDGVDVHTLVVHGTADFSAPVEVCGRPTAEAIPHAVYREYPDAGHGIYASHHNEINADLLVFLK